MPRKKIRVLIVDDSAFVRKILSEILDGDLAISVVGVASDPYIAAQRMQSEVPDVITLDIEMPRMDGLSFLERIMSQHPIPVVMCSSLTESGCKSAIRAMEYGAVAVVTKPDLSSKAALEEFKITICDAVKAAALIAPHRLSARPRQPEKKLSADVMLAKAANRSMIRTTEKVVIVGASTGGTADRTSSRRAWHRHRAAHAGEVHSGLRR